MVAIKIIDKTKLDGKMTKMVLREITVMDACSHPHLVRLYEVVENSSKIHLIMQLAPGRELFTKLSDQGENNKLFTKLCDQGENCTRIQDTDTASSMIQDIIKQDDMTLLYSTIGYRII